MFHVNDVIIQMCVCVSRNLPEKVTQERQNVHLQAVLTFSVCCDDSVFNAVLPVGRSYAVSLRRDCFYLVKLLYEVVFTFRVLTLALKSGL